MEIDQKILTIISSVILAMFWSFISQRSDKERKIKAEKIKCDCGITFEVEEGQTHCNYCGIKISDIKGKKINSKKGIKKTIKTTGNETPKRFLTILLGLAILFSAGLYVRAENIEKELRDKDFKSNSQPTPTVLRATPTLKPVTKKYIGPTPTVNSDPIINCNIHASCGGGSRQMKKSECDQTICCQIGNKWYFYLSKEKCKEDQKAGISNSYNTPTPYPACTIYYSSLGYSQTYYVAPEQCEQWKKDQIIPKFTPTPISTIDQAAIDEYNQLLKDHQAACLAAVSEWNTIKEQFMATQYNNYSSSAEAIMALEKMRQDYQQEMYEAGCSNTISL